MLKSLSRSSLLWLFCLGWIVVLPHWVRADSLSSVINPKRAANTWVSDMARVIDAPTERRINTVINNLERRTSAEMAVVTIWQTDGRTPKEFATQLFNRWGIGKRGRDNGVLFLIVMEARRAEVETGDGMDQRLPDARVQQILTAHVIPYFKDDDYAGGILNGVEKLAATIAKPVAASSGQNSRSRTTTSTPRVVQNPPVNAARPYSPSPSTDNEPYSAPTPPSTRFTWFPIAVAALGIPLIGWAAWNSRKRHCPTCKQEMRFLSESEDDVALATNQQFEENLGSVDYRVWRCDTCAIVTVERAVKWFSGYDDCPKCRHRTVQVQTDILRHPTYDHSGESRVTSTCRFPSCNYRDIQHRSLPRKTRPSSTSSSFSSSSRSSGSSGSFGGGSSSGGGAGASW
jgi:uncharacterized protein